MLSPTAHPIVLAITDAYWDFMISLRIWKWIYNSITPAFIGFYEELSFSNSGKPEKYIVRKIE